ncbi:hypothetical protein A2U01_0108510, partial [Trifolium medium]|nr:hypothetical protein [Trifolium medium]
MDGENDGEGWMERVGWREIDGERQMEREGWKDGWRESNET